MLAVRMWSVYVVLSFPFFGCRAMASKFWVVGILMRGWWVGRRLVTVLFG